MTVTETIYLDYAATTPVDPRVAAQMAECLCANGEFGNPASTHGFGRSAKARVESARALAAALIGARPSDLVFTSGATEANNLAILGFLRGLAAMTGVAAALPPAARARHVITARSEHKAVLDPCRQLEREGCRVTYLTPEDAGRVSPDQLRRALQADTVLVSLMHANNETGAIQDISAFAALCRAHGAALHVDAAQSAGKMPIDVQTMGVDLMSFTAHKLYGPKGIGALYVRPERRMSVQPLMFGGGHERGLRSGTLPVHQIVGFGTACALAAADLNAEPARLALLRARLWAGLADLPDVLLNSPLSQTLPGILNVAFCGVEGESLLFGLPELALSSGSACNSDSGEPSYVLRSLGLDRATAQSSLRFSLGRGTTVADIDRTVAAVRREVRRLRALVQPQLQMPAPLLVPSPIPVLPLESAPQLACGEAGSPEEGTWVRFMLNIQGNRVTQATHQVYGCPHTTAACAWVARRIEGRSASDPDLGGPPEWAAALHIPLERLTRLLIIEDALRAALAVARSSESAGGVQ